jgi:hypothetical protein
VENTPRESARIAAQKQSDIQIVIPLSPSDATNSR